MNGHSKVTRTGSSGVYSDVSSSTSSPAGSAGIGNDFNIRPATNLEKLLNQLPPELRKTTWEVRKEVAKGLNPKDLNDLVGVDYRLVASRLGFSAEVIEEFGKTSNPTLEMIKYCNTTSCQDFFTTVQNAGRSDVIDDLLSYLSTSTSNHYHLPTQESLEDESLSQPFEESCSDLSKLSKQSSEQQESDEEQNPVIPFKGSEIFWNRIPGNYSQKKWRDFCAEMRKSCPEKSDRGGIEKFLCIIFKINFESRAVDGEVKVEYFIRLLACFGPFEPGEDGCLKKIYDLMQNSISSDGAKKHSWFAGYMSQQEAHERLLKVLPGHFLIRFSGSRVDDGWFILGVKTNDDVPVQIEIKRDIVNHKHLLGEVPFPDLPSIVQKLRREPFLEECRQILSNPCPDLPLNANFIGYTQVSRRRGRGRGRIR